MDQNCIDYSCSSGGYSVGKLLTEKYCKEVACKFQLETGGLFQVDIVNWGLAERVQDRGQRWSPF
jgi:hypothetical protein